MPSAPGTILSSSLNCLGIFGIYAGEDVNSLSMDQIDNLLNNLETYYKSDKLTDEIKNHLKTAMKQRLTELNNLIENL